MKTAKPTAAVTPAEPQRRPRGKKQALAALGMMALIVAAIVAITAARSRAGKPRQ